jgi:hypothetical protein
MFGLIKNQHSSHLVSVWLLSALIVCLDGCSPSPPKERTATEIQMAAVQRTRWRKATILDDYERVGHKDPKWDDDARDALDGFVNMDFKDATEQGKDFERIAYSAAAAVAKGCDDPLVNYLHVFFGLNTAGRPIEESAALYRKTASDLSNSGYAEIRKFYGCARADNGLRALSFGRQYNVEARQHLFRALADKDLPASEAAPACLLMLDAIKEDVGPTVLETYQGMQKPLAEHFSRTPLPDLVKGYFYEIYAWSDRGTEPTELLQQQRPQALKLFEERMNVAATDLEKAWRAEPQNPVGPTEMMRMMTALGKDRPEMELWFGRAMKANPDNWDACNSKLNYLYSTGEFPAMLDFGRECLTNQAWGWTVTLMLVDAHTDVARASGLGKNYFRRPGVWEDIHAAFEEFFRRNPGAVSYHHNYALYADLCGDWKVLNEQLPLLGDINYQYFGGKQAFDAMLKRASDAVNK